MACVGDVLLRSQPRSNLMFKNCSRFKSFPREPVVQPASLLAATGLAGLALVSLTMSCLGWVLH